MGYTVLRRYEADLALQLYRMYRLLASLAYLTPLTAWQFVLPQSEVPRFPLQRLYVEINGTLHDIPCTPSTFPLRFFPRAIHGPFCEKKCFLRRRALRNGVMSSSASNESDEESGAGSGSQHNYGLRDFRSTPRWRFVTQLFRGSKATDRLSIGVRMVETSLAVMHEVSVKDWVDSASGEGVGAGVCSQRQLRR